MLCFDYKIRADSETVPIILFFFSYVNVVAICRGKIFIINPRFRVMPHAYEIYIEKETETSFRDFCTHTQKYSYCIHATCFILPNILRFSDFAWNENKTRKKRVRSGWWCAEESEPKMWIKLFSEYIHIHPHTFVLYKERHSWDESEIWYARCYSKKNKLSMLFFFLPVQWRWWWWYFCEWVLWALRESVSIYGYVLFIFSSSPIAEIKNKFSIQIA